MPDLQLPDIEIAPHLFYSEVCCDVCTRAPMNVDLLIAWHQLRSFVDSPIKITSGFRCPEKNASVGGSPRSQHLLGRAIDVQFPQLADLLELTDTDALPILERSFLVLLRQFGFRGVGVGHAYLHLDVRTGPRSLWSYRSTGEWVPVRHTLFTD